MNPSQNLKTQRMKRNILVILTLLAFSTAHSQTDKGQKFIGGQLNLQGNTSMIIDDLIVNNSQTFGLNVVPSFGYFVRDNFAVGATLIYGLSRSTILRETPFAGTPLPWTNKNESTTNGYGIGGFVRYYVDLSEKFKFYINGGMNYTYSTQENITTQNDPLSGNPGVPNLQKNLVNTANIAIAPGFVFFVTPKFGIQTSIGNVFYQYTHTRSKQGPSYTSNVANYGFNLNLSSFYFGVNFHF
jgi:outer membrane protein W